MATVQKQISDDFTLADEINGRVDPDVVDGDKFAFTEIVSVLSTDPATWAIAPPYDVDL